MNVRVIGGGVAAAILMVVTTGCEEQCVDRFDCRSFGQNFVCSDGQCVEGDPVPEGDAGTEDAGTDAGQVDAGMDDGGMDDGGMDDGGMDAGMLTCADEPCGGGSICADEDAGFTCTPLLVAVTRGAVNPRAITVPFNDPAATPNDLGAVTDSTYFPRFSGDGTMITWVQTPIAGGDVDLMIAPVANTGSAMLLARASDAGYEDFAHVEFAPAPTLLWTAVSGGAPSGGIWFLPFPGADQVNIAPGQFPEWKPDFFNGFAFSMAGFGVASVDPNEENPAVISPTGEEPQISPDGMWVAYRDSAGTIAGFDTEVFTGLVDGGTAMPNRVVAHEAPDGGAPGSYATHHEWGTASWITYTRVNVGIDNVSMQPAQCGPATVSGCQNRPAEEVLIQKIDSATGAAMGAAIVIGPGSVPSVSPDGKQLAYVNNGDLIVQALDANGMVAGTPIVHALGDVRTDDGDDSRPRWQPFPAE